MPMNGLSCFVVITIYITAMCNSYRVFIDAVNYNSKVVKHLKMTTGKLISQTEG